MIARDDARAILDRVVAIRRVRDLEASLTGGVYALTRFAENHIHQNVTEETLTLSVRAIDGRRLGQAAGTYTGPACVERIVRAAEEACGFMPEDPEVDAPEGPHDYPSVSAWVDRTAAVVPQDRAEMVRKVVRKCKAAGLRAAGLVATGTGGATDYGYLFPFARANSRGQFAYHAATDAFFSLTAQGPDASGWCHRTSHDIGDLDVDAEAERIVEKALRARRPRSVEAGRYTVVLEPAAVAELLSFLGAAFNALWVDEGRSLLTGKIGEKVFGDNFTLIEDCTHPLHQDRPWDGDGVPRRRVVLVEKGVVKGLVYDRKTARKHGVEPTGNGFGGTNAYGAIPADLVLQGRQGTVDDLVRGVEDGILVTRFWYNNFVDERRQIVTGMTRDGTFRIKKGKVSHGLKNLRFNMDWAALGNSIVRLGTPVLAGGSVVPPLVVKDFPFTSATRF